MIVQCPGCQREYDIHTHLLPGKTHYSLKCAFCDTHWRIGPKPVSSHHREHPLSQDLPPLPKGHPHADGPPPSFIHRWVHTFAFDWIVFLSALGIAVAVWVYEDGAISNLIHWPNFFASAFTSPENDAQKFMATGSSASDLDIGKISFSTIDLKGRNRLKVECEICNPTKETVACSDLAVSVWGKCPLNPEDEHEKRLLEQGIQHKACVLQQWVHPLEQLKLAPKKCQSLEIFAPGAGVIQATKVDVTWYHSLRVNASLETKA